MVGPHAGDKLKKQQRHTIEILIDRLIIKPVVERQILKCH